jgi:hypothetical protein
MSNEGFGLKICLDGERDFKNAIRDINNSFKVLGSEMNLVSSTFDKQDKSIEAITARNRVLNKEIDTQKQKVETLEKALNNASEAFGENDKRTLKWQVQLNNAKADLNGFEKELKQNDTALNNVGKEFDDAEKQSEQFEKAIKSSSDTANHAEGRFSKLGSTLGKIGVGLGAGVAAIGAAAIGAGKALANTTVSASQYADEILTQSTVTGMSTESLQAYKYAAELIDTDLETLTKTMSKNIKSMDSARSGTGATAEAYKKLGITVTDANGNLKDGETVYWQAIDALGKMKNETERDATAMQLFGKSARDLNPLIAQGSGGMAKLTDEAKRMGAVMSTDTLNSLGKFDDSMQRLKSGAGAAKNMLGTVLLPQLQILADEGGSLLGEFTKGIGDANGDWGKISDVIGSTVGGITNMLMDNLPKIIELGLDIVKSIGKAVMDNLPMIIDAAVSIVMTLVKGLIDAMPQLTKGALQLILALLDGLIENLPALVEAAILMVVTLAAGIGDALPELIPKIIDAIILIVETLINNLGLILDSAFKIIEGLAEGLLNALPRLIDALPEIILCIVDFITNNLPMIISIGIKIIIMLAVGIIKAIPKLLLKLPEIITAILQGLAGAGAAVMQIGIAIVMGLWDGIKSMGKWLTDNFMGFFDGIVNGAKDFLGIKSPSTVFAGIGGNMGEGVGVGFLKSMGAVEKKIKGAIPTTFDMNASLKGLTPVLATTDSIVTYNHTGTIRVEGINDKGQLTSVVDIIIDELRREVRR